MSCTWFIPFQFSKNIEKDSPRIYKPIWDGNILGYVFKFRVKHIGSRKFWFKKNMKVCHLPLAITETNNTDLKNKCKRKFFKDDILTMT